MTNEKVSPMILCVLQCMLDTNILHNERVTFPIETILAAMRGAVPDFSRAALVRQLRSAGGEVAGVDRAARVDLERPLVSGSVDAAFEEYRRATSYPSAQEMYRRLAEAPFPEAMFRRVIRGDNNMRRRLLEWIGSTSYRQVIPRSELARVCNVTATKLTTFLHSVLPGQMDEVLFHGASEGRRYLGYRFPMGRVELERLVQAYVPGDTGAMQALQITRSRDNETSHALARLLARVEGRVISLEAVREVHRGRYRPGRKSLERVMRRAGMRFQRRSSSTGEYEVLGSLPMADFTPRLQAR